MFPPISTHRDGEFSKREETDANSFFFVYCRTADPFAAYCCEEPAQHNQAELIATVNEEFIYQLQHRPGQKYTIISGPNNVWVSKKGKIHWIPIITQIENNLLEIEVSGNNMKEKHKLNIFVNAPPVISYRPDKQEAIFYAAG